MVRAAIRINPHAQVHLGGRIGADAVLAAGFGLRTLPGLHVDGKAQCRARLDATLLAGFLATFFLDLTGLVAHQWLGMAVGLLAG